MKNFLTGVVVLVAAAILAYIFFTIGIFVLSIALAVGLIAALMIWATSFFMLKKHSSSLFTSSSVTTDDKGDKKTTIIDVEFSEVKKKK